MTNPSMIQSVNIGNESDAVAEQIKRFGGQIGPHRIDICVNGLPLSSIELWEHDGQYAINLKSEA